MIRPPQRKPHVLALNARGAGDLHGLRAHRLCAWLSNDAHVTYHDVDRSLPLLQAARAVARVLRSDLWDLVYLEGTGIAAGASLIAAARGRRRQRFVVSSGDPIAGFFQVTKGPLFGRAFSVYEKRLYGACAGFIGWTPYLTGAALRLGARRAVTIEGAVDPSVFRPLDETTRRAARDRFGLPADHLVCGVVGSLRWTPRQQYCYGLELIETLKRLRRPDVSLLIVGDGNGRRVLEERLPAALASRVVFTGRLPEAEVVTAMNALDIGFITQTLDALGQFRLTTKLPEYLACGVPVAMSPVPGFFDYVGSAAGWPLPPLHPASAAFHEQCAAWLDRLPRDTATSRRGNARALACARFDYAIVGERFRGFIKSVLGGGGDGGGDASRDRAAR